jgi:hypothetical protein
VKENINEFLEESFPDGYVIVYTNPNGDLRVGRFNPKGFEELEKYHDLILETRGKE